MKFNENLRNLRREKDLSQEALAADMSVTRQTISKWENGTAMPDLKKLTELAEYFGVSMDALLGTQTEKDGESSAVSGEDAEIKQYINEMLAYSEIKQQAYGKRQAKTFYIILAFVIIIFAVSLFIMSFSLSEQITALSERPITVQTQEQDDFYDGDTENISYKIIGFDSEKPYMAKVRFEYCPESYPKGADIYFLVPHRDGNSQKVQAEIEDGVFFAQTDVDISAGDNIYLYIDDGNTVERRRVPSYFAEDCFSNVYTVAPFAEITYGSMQTVTVSFTESSLYFKKITPGAVTSAKVVVESCGNECFSEELRFTADNDGEADFSAELNDISFKLPSQGVGNDTNLLYFSFTDDYETQYRFYPLIDGENFNYEKCVTGFDCCEIIFNTGDGRVVISNTQEQ